MSEHSEEGTGPQEISAAAATEDSEEATNEETAAAATEDSEDATGPKEISADLKMVYAIANEFLGQITLNNPEAEELLQTALGDESRRTASMQQRIERVFSPIFLLSEWLARPLCVGTT